MKLNKNKLKELEIAPQPRETFKILKLNSGFTYLMFAWAGE